MTETKLENKRTPYYNVDNNAINELDDETLLRVYGKIVKSRLFELGAVKAVEEKRVLKLLYLSLGQESAVAALSELVKDYYIFAQHRVHDIYLSIGGSPRELRDEYMSLPTGFFGGRTGSNTLGYVKNGIKMIGHNGLIGEQVSLAAGCAFASGEKTACFFGDGSIEEDFVLSSMGFAVTRKLPLLFVCIDNDLSVLTKTSERRNWDAVKVAEGFGMKAHDLSDCPWSVLKIAKKWTADEPLLINIRVCRERWHAGTGIDNEREWERDIIVRKQLVEKGLEKRVVDIENTIGKEMDDLWKS